MFWIDFLFIVIFAFILSSILTWGFGWRHPARRDASGAAVLFAFLVLFLAMWAGGAWLAPVGPVFYGSSWLGFMMIGIFVVLLILAVAAPERRPPTSVEAEREAEETAAVAVVFGVFFWILIMALMITGLIALFA